MAKKSTENVHILYTPLLGLYEINFYLAKPLSYIIWYLVKIYLI